MVKARFSDGVLVPDETLDMEDGDEVELHIIRHMPASGPKGNVPDKNDRAPEDNGDASWKDARWSAPEYWHEFKKYIYEARLDGSRRNPRL